MRRLEIPNFRYAPGRANQFRAVLHRASPERERLALLLRFFRDAAAFNHRELDVGVQWAQANSSTRAHWGSDYQRRRISSRSRELLPRLKLLPRNHRREKGTLLRLVIKCGRIGVCEIRCLYGQYYVAY